MSISTPVAPPVVLQCRMCGSVPAADVTFRKHTGMLLLMRFGSATGPFCRDCGLAMFRRLQAHTLVAGWWSYASVIAGPITMIINMVRRGKVAKLPAPDPIAGHRPMPPGPPVLERWQAVGLVVPLTALFLLIASVVRSG
jgi:hypothetical protein